MNRQIKRLAALFLVFCLAAGLLTPVPVRAESHTDYTPQELLEVMEGIISWEKDKEHLSDEAILLDSIFLRNVGNSNIDWLVFGMGRSGYPDDYAAYQALAAENMSSRYQNKELMERDKATEWHRMALAILASGGDPTAVGKDENGNPINLIADGIYDMKEGMSLGDQGLNGYSWGLLTLDALRYQVPEGAQETRQSVITHILERQLSDGGFALGAIASEDTSDVDMTAMMIQALAPYYNSEETYTYSQMGTDVTKTVRQVVDEALAWLSEQQLVSGGFESWNMENSESCSQVIVALCALGIDPGKDERFCKDGMTALDALMSYRMKDGGFLHSREYDEDNPDADPKKSNMMASTQAYYALTALCRYYGDMRTLYDFRQEQTEEVKGQINAARTAIEALGDHADEAALQGAFELYLAVPASERSYVWEYRKLADQMQEAGMENTSEGLTAAMEINTKGNGTITSLFGADIDLSADIRFTDADAAAVRELPEDITTESYVTVVKLLDKLEKSENKEEYPEELTILEEKKAQIAKIQNEIAGINQAVLDQLYPLDEITQSDKAAVSEIEQRIAALSEYDRQQIQQYEDIRQAAVRIKNQETAMLLSAAAAVVILVILIIVIVRIKKRGAAKRRQNMRDGRYDDEDDDEDDDEEE